LGSNTTKEHKQNSKNRLSRNDEAISKFKKATITTMKTTRLFIEMIVDNPVKSGTLQPLQHTTVKVLLFVGDRFSWISWLIKKKTQYNTRRNAKCPYYYFEPSMKPGIKEPTKKGIFIKPRKLPSTNESTFEVFFISIPY